MQIREGIHDGFKGEVELKTMKRGFPLEKMRKAKKKGNHNGNNITLQKWRKLQNTDKAEVRNSKLWQLEYPGHIKSPIKRSNIIPTVYRCPINTPKLVTYDPVLTNYSSGWNEMVK